MEVSRVDIRELRDRLEEWVSFASAGEEVIVTEGDIPRARLVPVTTGAPRVPGLHVGAIQTTDDFDAPLPDGFWLGAP